MLPTYPQVGRLYQMQAEGSGQCSLHSNRKSQTLLLMDVTYTPSAGRISSEGAHRRLARILRSFLVNPLLQICHQLRHQKMLASPKRPGKKVGHQTMSGLYQRSYRWNYYLHLHLHLLHHYPNPHRGLLQGQDLLNHRKYHHGLHHEFLEPAPDMDI